MSLNTPLVRVVDDDDQLREALEFMLMSEGLDVACFASGEEFLAAAPFDAPGCIVLDVRMPGMSGLIVQNKLNAMKVQLPIVFLTGHGDLEMAVDSMREGACDFQLKPLNPDKLIVAIRRAIEKDARFRAESARKNPTVLARARYDSLTDRERQILQDVARGLSNKAIGEHFGLSYRTVEFHRANALRKIHAKTPAEAAAFLSLLMPD